LKRFQRFYLFLKIMSPIVGCPGVLTLIQPSIQSLYIKKNMVLQEKLEILSDMNIKCFVYKENERFLYKLKE